MSRDQDELAGLLGKAPRREPTASEKRTLAREQEQMRRMRTVASASEVLAAEQFRMTPEEIAGRRREFKAYLDRPIPNLVLTHQIGQAARRAAEMCDSRGERLAEMLESKQPLIRKPGEPYPTIPYIDPRRSPQIFDSEPHMRVDEMVALAKARRSEWPKPGFLLTVDSNLPVELAKAADGVMRAAYQRYVDALVTEFAARVIQTTESIWWPENLNAKMQIGPTDV